MKTNMGKFDRVFRIIVALVIAALYFNGIISGTLAIILMILAAVFVLTSFVGVCPLYLPFGLSTKKKDTKAV
jgi:K+-transporting ATPase A subunit